ncbi:hypothetical protein [uncultured Tateyamaria sp.]|uniref:hypothetical protein n=1 Tax=uncultured Tateyamaria sp. TaxID=455651 RepID=UPI0026303D03|nr:hypothetical protein [uncultured Tateyamaria sp.]
MKLTAAEAAVAALERYMLQVARNIADREKIKTDHDQATLDSLVGAFPDPDKLSAFADAMPATPDLKALMAAFPNPVVLGTMVNDTLGGDIKLFAVLAEKGCKRDPALLKTLADKLQSDPGILANFKSMLSEGGLAKNPDALAAMLQGGCDGNADRFATVCGKFANPGERAALDAVLSAGGMGTAPEAFGALAGRGDGDVLKQLTVDFAAPADQAKLSGLMTKGGMDGRAAGRPDMLADVIEHGLGNNPARLVELYDGFAPSPPAAEDLGSLEAMLTAFDGTDKRAGQRLNSAITGFLNRYNTGPPPPVPLMTEAQAAARLRTPFMTNLNALCGTAGAPDVVANAASSGAGVASARPLPPQQVGTGAVEASLDGPAAARLLDGALAEPDRTQAAILSDASTILKGAADDLGASVAGDADAERTTQTTDATAALKDLTDALVAKLEGATLAEIEAVRVATRQLLPLADTEPNVAARDAAIVQIKASGDAIDLALKRLAAATATAAGPAGVATQALGLTLARAAGAPAAEQAALKGLMETAQLAAGASAASAGDPAALAAAAKKGVDDVTPGGDRAAAYKVLDDAAERCTAAANAATATLMAAPRPVEIALIDHAARCADEAARAGQAAVDQTKGQAALKAAKAAADAVALAVRTTAAAADTAAAFRSATAKPMMAAATQANAARDAIERMPANTVGRDDMQLAADVAAASARFAALTEADRAALVATGDPALEQAAKDAAYRKAAETKGSPPDAGEVTAQITTANLAAVTAATAADTARVALTASALPAVLPALYENLIEACAVAAEAALGAAREAENKVNRDTALTAAGAAATAAAEGARKLAEYQITQAKTILSAQQGTANGVTTAARTNGEADLVAGNPVSPAHKSALITSTGNATRAMADSGAALLSELMAPPVPPAAASAIHTAFSDAAEKTALAAAPGASCIAQIEACEAYRAAQDALSAKAITDFGVAVGVAALTPPGGANAGAIQPAARAIEAGQAAAKAATSSCTAFKEAARKVKIEIARHVARLQQIDVAKRTVTETADLNALQNRPVGVDQKIADADARQLACTASLTALDARCRDLMMWINQHHQGAANSEEVVTAAGMTNILKGEKHKHAGAMGKDDLIRNAASLVAAPYTGAAAAQTPHAAVLAPNPNPYPAETTSADLAHIAERHVYETMERNGRSFPPQEEYIVGALSKADWIGAQHPRVRPQAVKDLAKATDAAKTTSMLPETITGANMAAFVTSAIQKAKEAANPNTLLAAMTAGLPPVPGGPAVLPNAYQTAVNGVWDEYDVNVDVPSPPPPTISIHLGFELNTRKWTPPPGPPPAPPQAVPTEAVLGQMYPNPGPDVDSIIPSDMLTIGRAIGI